MNHLKLEKRKESIGKLRSIVSALRSMAALRVQQTLNPLKGMREYRDSTLASIARFRSLAEIPISASREKNRNLLIIFCSEYGFVGGFNRGILEEASKIDRADFEIGLVGTRGITLAEELNIKPDWVLKMSSDHNSVQHTARDISSYIFEAVNDGISSIKLLYTEKKGAIETAIKLRQLFPVETTKSDQDKTPQDVPLLNMPPKDILGYLIEEYIMASIGCTVMESLHAENIVRMNSMDYVYHNISKKYDHLSLLSHQKYQEEITTELFDIITGFKAQKENKLNSASE
ncbi:MAG: F0F1 ATP synthase subunit gamma [Alphaproteobacteria bacterium]|nr:F0F1 ATP synthase subunit gamma [Alphaproteobacteria bacterium]HPF46076.1 F0F1 ATP synthase subunit gamma [Emcibacteraceae bacterium]HRW29721.1 F0F1 ATP synthase subunit gamma [Emcibacteraceae bacterium]